MTIRELITRLESWAEEHGDSAILTSDFSIIEIAGKPTAGEIDMENEGTQPT